jgi:phytoene/squalene synthetase
MVTQHSTATDQAAATRITAAVMEAVEKAVSETRPADPYHTAVAGLVGAVLALIFSAMRGAGQDSIRQEAEHIASAVVRAAEHLLEAPPREEVH